MIKKHYQQLRLSSFLQEQYKEGTEESVNTISVEFWYTSSQYFSQYKDTGHWVGGEGAIQVEFLYMTVSVTQVVWLEWLPKKQNTK